MLPPDAVNITTVPLAYNRVYRLMLEYFIMPLCLIDIVGTTDAQENNYA